jgi:hypothetical protein
VLGWRLACVGDSLVNHVIESKNLMFKVVVLKILVKVALIAV